MMVWSVLIVVSASIVLHTSQLTNNEERQLARIEEQIAEEKLRTRVLEAEWTMLTKPERLETLSRRYIETLAPMIEIPTLTLADLPERLQTGAEDLPMLADAEQKAQPNAQPVAAKVAEARIVIKPTGGAESSGYIRAAARTQAAMAKPVVLEEEDPISQLIADEGDSDLAAAGLTTASMTGRPAQAGAGVLWANMGGDE
jgi:hypothetical protein